MKTLREINVKNKRVLVRCDFNVPLDDKGNILDDFRIRQALPTINYLIKEKAGVILMSHLGSPGGKFKKELQMAPVIERLNKLLQNKVAVLENLRFNPREEENDDNFAKELAQKGNIYVNDAFSVCHREHASLVAITKYLPSCAGFLLEKEINALEKVIKKPIKPLVAILGGAKVETKTKLLDNVSDIADYVLVGGLLKKELNEKNISLKNPQKIIGAGSGLDIPQEDVEKFKEKISQAKTILWNGPLGKTEDENFTKGTEQIIKAIIDSGAYSVVGGGETVEFINKLGLVDKFSHVSTGGGAMIAFLAGEKLPGLEALG